MAVIKNNTMMITHYNRRLILSNQLSVGYVPICMQILDLSGTGRFRSKAGRI